jgi:hypothetical protein
MVAEPLLIKQGTTRTVTITHIRDTTGNLLDPTGWGIHAVARPGYWADPVAVWKNNPGTGELLAEVVDANPLTDPTVVTGEKWIELHIDPTVSDGWTWMDAKLDAEIHEPPPGVREETFSADLRLVPTTVRT